MAAVQAAYNVKAAAIIAITTTGRTAKEAAKYRPVCPIVAVTRFRTAAKQLQLYRGVVPLFYAEDRLEDWTKDVDERIQVLDKRFPFDCWMKVNFRIFFCSLLWTLARRTASSRAETTSSASPGGVRARDPPTPSGSCEQVKKVRKSTKLHKMFFLVSATFLEAFVHLGTRRRNQHPQWSIKI